LVNDVFGTYCMDTKMNKFYPRKSLPRKRYHVGLKKMVPRYGGWSNYISTPSLARAQRLAKKLPLKWRQIDVRIKGKRAYVLDRSWL
jgi:hypothetical protein